MFNLIVRRNGRELQQLPQEPKSYWDPFREMAPFWHEPEQPVRYAPDFDVKETQEGYLFKADLPGIKEKDLEIIMTGNRLTISGMREEEKDEKRDTYYACERAFGTFTRVFTLPEVTGDHIHAELRAGVLTLFLPKKPELQPRRIEVKVTEKAKS